MAIYTNDDFICKKDIYIIKINKNALNYKYLLGLINSKLISYYKTNNSGSAKKDDFTQIILSDIRELPIPPALENIQIEFEKLVDQIISIKQQNLDTTDLEAEIDRLVYELYGLTEDEIKIIENG